MRRVYRNFNLEEYMHFSYLFEFINEKYKLTLPTGLTSIFLKQQIKIFFKIYFLKSTTPKIIII